MAWWREELRSQVCWRAFERTPHLMTDEAVNMLAAIALAESGGKALFGVGKGGWPLENGKRGLWRLDLDRVIALGRDQKALRLLHDIYPYDAVNLAQHPVWVWRRLAWDNVLACRVARSLLWTVPEPLPPVDPAAVEEAYRQYVSTWYPDEDVSVPLFRGIWRKLTT